MVSESALARRGESTGKAPQLSDLRDSGELEQDADQVWMLWRPHLYNEHEDKHQAALKVAKHRNGQTGTVEWWFESSQERFRERGLQDPLPPPQTARTRSRKAALGMVTKNRVRPDCCANVGRRQL